jgi:hypothetical protein
LTRRGVALFEKNPYIVEASANTVEGTKRRTLKSRDGSQLMITSEGGDFVAPAGFWQTQEVDKTQFVKLYINGVKAFRDLAAPGTKVFEVLYTQVQENIGKDKVYLSFNAINQDATPMSEATYTRGMRELILKGFIAPSMLQGWYWVNPDYMWNGDRLAYVKEFRLKRDVASDQAWRERLESKGQLRLDQE